jgi:protease PrsW
MADFQFINQTLNTILIGIGIGFLPSLLWLFFWLREDKHPEPTRIIIRTFMSGLIAVPVAIFLQFGVLKLLGYSGYASSLELITGGNLILVIILWAAIEEILKLIACAEASLVRKEDNEPIDPVIYLITAALGFAALENTLFILSPLFDGNIVGAMISINMRFIGATLLHILCSGLIGALLGLVFYRSRNWRLGYGALGLLGAIVLHSVFNLLIIKAQTYMFGAFALVWVLVIALIIIIERIKLIKS